MKTAFIENDVAMTVCRVDPATIFNAWYAAQFVEVPEAVEAGWVRDAAGNWTPPPVVVVVPQEIAPLQGLLALDKFGLSSQYEAWSTDSARTFAERAFINRAQTWRRNDPTLLAASDAFGLTPERLDELFIEGAKL